MYSVTAVKRRFQLPKCDMDQLKRFKTLPGTYNMEQSTYKSRMTIVSAYQALMFVDEYPYRPSPASLVQRGQILNFMGTCALPYYDTSTGQVEEGVSCAGCQLLVANGCVMRDMKLWSWAYEARNTLYSRDGFLEHFRWCKQAHRRWNDSDEGKKLPPDLRSLLDHSRQEVDKNT
ncbi:Cyclin-like F-box, partial [Metarhizium brunneum ARSEF 3297]